MQTTGAIVIVTSSSGSEVAGKHPKKHVEAEKRGEREVISQVTGGPGFK